MAIDEEKIFSLNRQINELLDERPEYKVLQKQIRERLRNAGNSHNRLVLINKMMMEKVKELQKALEDLNKIEPKLLK